MAKSIRNFESLIEGGENPNGFTAQTANGTAHWRGEGWNRDQPNDMGLMAYDDYNRTPDHQIAPSAVWPAGRSNRTGE